MRTTVIVAAALLLLGAANLAFGQCVKSTKTMADGGTTTEDVRTGS